MNDADEVDNTAIPTSIGEVAWVESIIGAIEQLVAPMSNGGVATHACWGHPVAYSHEIERYDSNDEVMKARRDSYRTDLLVYDEFADKSWVPRVIIECKLGQITTHDALTYSSKAATHKHVHPFLRYGVLIGNWEGYPLPPRLVRHGAYFDFMAVLEGKELTSDESSALMGLLQTEVSASRQLQDLLFDRSQNRKKYRFLHRPLKLTEYIQ